jgi:hypothetical protein
MKSNLYTASCFVIYPLLIIIFNLRGKHGLYHSYGNRKGQSGNLQRRGERIGKIDQISFSAMAASTWPL